jgi:hypothetical protein
MRKARGEGPDGWTRGERSVLRRLSTPARIQDYVDRLVYRAEDDPGCPRRVMEEGRANCYDGAVFAAAALRRLGHPPRLLDMWADRDDDHVLAVFEVDGHYGAVAKSNFVGLRYREPIHRTLRELALSYFEDYFTEDRRKTLRSHTGLLSLAQFDRLRWTFRDEPLRLISDRLDAMVHRPLLTAAMARRLAPVDGRSLRGGMVGTLAEGLYRKAGARNRG